MNGGKRIKEGNEIRIPEFTGILSGKKKVEIVDGSCLVYFTFKQKEYLRYYLFIPERIHKYEFDKADVRTLNETRFNLIFRWKKINLREEFYQKRIEQYGDIFPQVLTMENQDEFNFKSYNKKNYESPDMSIFFMDDESLYYIIDKSSENWYNFSRKINGIEFCVKRIKVLAESWWAKS